MRRAVAVFSSGGEVGGRVLLRWKNRWELCLQPDAHDILMSFHVRLLVFHYSYRPHVDITNADYSCNSSRLHH